MGIIERAFGAITLSVLHNYLTLTIALSDITLDPCVLWQKVYNNYTKHVSHNKINLHPQAGSKKLICTLYFHILLEFNRAIVVSVLRFLYTWARTATTRWKSRFFLIRICIASLNKVILVLKIFDMKSTSYFWERGYKNSKDQMSF